MNDLSTAERAPPTLERWLTGPRFRPLPARQSAAPPPALSFEFFPPKTEALEAQLWACVRRLESLTPRFVSVTYGAGGSTQARTHATVSRLVAETSLVPAAHLTCIGASRGEVDDVARQYWDAGVRHIVALRGDAPVGQAYVPHPQGYAYASDLVAGLKRVADFEISVAAYPETHPSATSAEAESRQPQAQAGRRRDPGDHPVFLRKRGRICGSWTGRWRRGSPPRGARHHARVQLHPGGEVQRHVRRVHPEWLGALFDGTENDPETRRMVAAVVAAEQVRLLQANGVDEFHFYTLNRPDLTYAIAHILGARPGRSGDEAKPGHGSGHRDEPRPGQGVVV